MGILGTKQGYEKQTLGRYSVIQVQLEPFQTGPQVCVPGDTGVICGSVVRHGATTVMGGSGKEAACS